MGRDGSDESDVGGDDSDARPGHPRRTPTRRPRRARHLCLGILAWSLGGRTVAKLRRDVVVQPTVAESGAGDDDEDAV